jgi:hypothetical protein
MHDCVLSVPQYSVWTNQFMQDASWFSSVDEFIMIHTSFILQHLRQGHVFFVENRHTTWVCNSDFSVAGYDSSAN